MNPWPVIPKDAIEFFRAAFREAHRQTPSGSENSAHIVQYIAGVE